MSRDASQSPHGWVKTDHLFIEVPVLLLTKAQRMRQLLLAYLAGGRLQISGK